MSDKAPALVGALQSLTNSSPRRAHRVGGALNEGLDLHHVLVFQLGGEVRHALIAERAFEDEVLQVRNRLGRDITEFLDVAALVDAGTPWQVAQAAT